jgi:hypothetical protein
MPTIRFGFRHIGGAPSECFNWIGKEIALIVINDLMPKVLRAFLAGGGGTR